MAASMKTALLWVVSVSKQHIKELFRMQHYGSSWIKIMDQKCSINRGVGYTLKKSVKTDFRNMWGGEGGFPGTQFCADYISKEKHARILWIFRISYTTHTEKYLFQNEDWCFLGCNAVESGRSVPTSVMCRLHGVTAQKTPTPTHLHIRRRDLNSYNSKRVRIPTIPFWL